MTGDLDRNAVPENALPGFAGDGEQLRRTLESLLEGVQVLSPEWRYLYLNQAAADHGRKAHHELLGRNMLECFPGVEHLPLFHEFDRCMRERCSSRIESEYEFPDGERRWYELRMHPCPEGLVILTLDITERKRLETTLRQTQKIRALGQFAAGVMHDIRNFLNPIEFELSILEQHASKGTEVVHSLAELRSAVKRAKELIGDLGDFARQPPEPVESRCLSLNEMVQQARRLGTSHASHIQVNESLTASSPIRVESAELLSALLNLIANAVEAMPDGGQLHLTTGSSDVEVWVEVRDSGIGMDPDVQLHALEPFFSTKGGSNSGLGLAMVYAFVARNDGTVQVRSEAGKGTSVRMSFPVG